MTFLLDQDTLWSGWTDIHCSQGKLYRYAFIKRHSHIDIAIQTPRSPRRGEDSNYHLIHKIPLSLGSDILKICFRAGKEPKTLEMALNMLKAFIDLYSEFLSTGKSIDQQLQERQN